jgi:flagellar biosynthesis protein FlhF
MKAPIRIKSFRAKDLSEALRHIRLELGPDAIILETKLNPRSRFSWSQPHVEVTASSAAPAETEGTDIPEAIPPQPEETIDLPGDDPNRSSILTPTTSYPRTYIQLASDLLLRDVPKEQVEAWLEEAMSQLGADVSDAWVLRVHLAKMLRRDIPTDCPSRSWDATGTAIALVGPPGHGKSSAVAKLASFAAIHCGFRPLVIACLHPSQPPHPRLADYCDLMGWRYEQIDAPKLAAAVAAGIERGNWIAIDTPSIPIGDIEGMKAWRSMLGELALAQMHVALSATTAATHARRLLDWYQVLSPTHLLLSRLDEAGGLGSFYPFLSTAQLPVGFASFGPKIPEDIAECEPGLLAQWILGS